MFVGLIVVYLGYRLFCRGIFDTGGDFEATWHDNKLILKRAAPGTFFALFGTLIIAVSLWHGIHTAGQFTPNTQPSPNKMTIVTPASCPPASANVASGQLPRVSTAGDNVADRGRTRDTTATSSAKTPALAASMRGGRDNSDAEGSWKIDAKGKAVPQ
jgi:hypothetical protein